MTERQYVIFKLNEEEYGIEITNVKEITEYKQVNRIPNVSDFIEGIVNIRGDIIPIINLKKKFDIEEKGLTKDKRVIIINLNKKLVGFIVDEASQVLRIAEEDIEDASKILTGMDRRFIEGIGKIDEKIIVLIDLKEVLNENEKQEVEGIE